MNVFEKVVHALYPQCLIVAPSSLPSPYRWVLPWASIFLSLLSSLLYQVHDLEKKYACTTKALGGHGAGDGGVKGLAVLCVEVANWRSKQKLVRLRFRLSTSFACCVGAPEVEVRAPGWVGWGVGDRR